MLKMLILLNKTKYNLGNSFNHVRIFLLQNIQSSLHVCVMWLFYYFYRAIYCTPDSYTLILSDNLYMNNHNIYYYHSQTSLDRSPHEYNGRIRNGSVYSAHSTSSLTNPQHYLQPSPMSSNPSITGSDVARPDYSQRHSIPVPPTYRATPDYESVMRQKNRSAMVAMPERHSHSMRNLNIGNSYAYSRPDPLVYSQPEIREGTAAPYHLNYSFHSPLPYPYPSEKRSVVGAVSVPELTNVQLAQAHAYPPNIMRAQVYRPPPPYHYSRPRPANSTPDLSRHLHASSSSPDLITRRVHHSVQTFQEDSLPVAHSLQEVSEPLIPTTVRRPYMHKRNSVELAGLSYGVENMRLKERTVSASATETHPPLPPSIPPHIAPSVVATMSELESFQERAEPQVVLIKEELHFGHKKSLSNATMLVHSSGEEEEFEEDSGRHTPLSQEVPEAPEEHVNILDVPLLETPLPAYSYSPSLDPVISSSLGFQPQPRIHEQDETVPLYPLSEVTIMPSVSDGDLSSSGYAKPKREMLKKRPVSDEPIARRNFDGLPPNVSECLARSTLHMCPKLLNKVKFRPKAFLRHRILMSCFIL